MARDEAYREAERRIEAALENGATELDLSDMGLTEVPEAIGQLTNLQKLNLGGKFWKDSKNQLTKVPEVIFSLTQLQWLDLDNNQLTEVPAALAALTQLQSLSLNNNQLTEVPAALAALTQLQSLSLDNNQLTEVPEVIFSLTQLQSLSLNKNQLTEVPAALAALTQLQSLSLDNNQLTEVPEVIFSLTQLRALYLDNNQLTEVPAALAALTQLRALYLDKNQLTKVPEVIFSLTQLQLLSLNKNQLTEVPAALAALTQLQWLDLSKNQLTEVPAALAALTQLQWLDLSKNQLTEVPAALAALTQLQWLDLSKNQLTEVPAALAALTQLRALDLSKNQLTEVPAALAALTQLQWLDLSNNQLTEVPAALAALTQLQRLYLSNNQLTEVPHSLIKLIKLTELKLDKNPLNPDFAAANEQGIEAVMQYLRAKAEGEVTLNEAKLILVGEGEVGKSCLLGALRGDQWIDGRPTTHGIEIKPVIVKTPDCNTEITLNGWDFGGQRVYRPTHQLFFSAPAVYLVVWKPREGPQQGFVKEWITLIKHREPDAKILVVATHGGPGQRQPDIDRQELFDLFGRETIIDFFHIDSKPHLENQSCSGIAELKETIAKIAITLPGVGRTVPQKWQQIQKLLEQSNKTHLPYKDVIAICEEQGLKGFAAELFVRVSHTLGYLIHYHYDPILQDIVILKPDWLAKAISFVLDDKTTREQNGLVNFDHLSNLWSYPPFANEKGYPKELHPVFLRLMERFDLSYKVVFDPNEPSNTSLIAQLVPDQRPELFPDWGELPAPGDRQQVQICRIVDDRGQFANAEGLFYQLIVRLHKYSLGREKYQDSIHWQRGLMLDNDYNGRALLEYIGTDIKITVRAAYPERFLSYLTEEVKWLIEHFWEGLRCNVMVSCVEPCGRKAPGQGLFEVEKLIESKKKNRHDYPCPITGCDEWQDIDKMLSNASTSKPLSPDINAEKVRNIVDEIKTTLSKESSAILSQIDAHYEGVIQTFIDEAKDWTKII